MQESVEMCGFAIDDKTGPCTFAVHRLGTPHSWAPPLPTQRPGETILQAERREMKEREA